MIILKLHHFCYRYKFEFCFKEELYSLFVYLFTLVWTHSFWFFHEYLTAIVIYFNVQIISDLTSGNQFKLASLSIQSTPIILIHILTSTFPSLPYFQACFLFPPYGPFLCGAAITFSGRWYLETKAWVHGYILVSHFVILI